MKSFKVIFDVNVEVNEIEGNDQYIQKQQRLLESMMKNENVLTEYLKLVATALADEPLMMYGNKNTKVNRGDDFQILSPAIKALSKEDRNFFFEAEEAGYLSENIEELMDSIKPVITKVEVID